MLAVVASVGLAAQSASPAAPSQFTRVSITQASGAESPGAIRFTLPRGLHARNVTLVDLIKFAHQRHAFDERVVVGGPSWTTADRFDLEVVAATEHALDPSGVPGTTLRGLQSLLGEHFALAVHEEVRELPIYALTRVEPAVSLGPRLRQSEIDCSALGSSKVPPKRGPGLGPPCSTKNPPGRLFAHTLPMPAMASLLGRHLDRPVVDRTQLSGPFDMELEALEIKALPGYQPGPSDLALPPPAGPTVFVAVREQLGLELKAVDGAVSVIVIDRAERPKR
jgi:uncharacterized protein (TIGR03435 family)